MEPTKDGIIVSVDMEQKDVVMYGDKSLLVPIKFTTNYREKTPVVCRVVVGNGQVKEGAILVVHHNYFQEHSQYEMDDGLYSFPVGRSVFFEIDEDGNPKSMCGNIVCERVEKSTKLPAPPSGRKNYNDRVIVTSAAEGFSKGDMLLTWPFSDYECVYNWKGIIHRVVKVFKDDVCAVLRKTLDSDKNV